MVEPWINSSIWLGSSPLLRMQSTIPCTNCAGVVRLLASTKRPAVSSNPTRSVKVPPMSIATKIKAAPSHSMPSCFQRANPVCAFVFGGGITVNWGQKHGREQSLPTLKELVRGDDLVVAPVALNPIMARLAEQAGFKAIDLSGGSRGWLKCVTEANLTLPELAEVALDMRTVCKLPIILDAGGGWGDPAHMHRTIAMTEAAGLAAIELEDQLLPRHFEHHIGNENLV